MITLIEFYKHPEQCLQYHGDVTEDTIEALEELEGLRKEVARLRVPEGWKIVPVEPTYKMLDVALDALDQYGDSLRITYEVMVSAAPSPEDVAR